MTTIHRPIADGSRWPRRRLGLVNPPHNRGELDLLRARPAGCLQHATATQTKNIIPRSPNIN